MGMALFVAVTTGFACYRAGWRLSMIVVAAALAGAAVAAMGL
jgi:hypothetical protein